MSWTSCWTEFTNIPQLSEYLSELMKTLYSENPSCYAIGNIKLLVVNQRFPVPGLFYGFYNWEPGAENINLMT